MTSNSLQVTSLIEIRNENEDYKITLIENSENFPFILDEETLQFYCYIPENDKDSSRLFIQVLIFIYDIFN